LGLLSLAGPAAAQERWQITLSSGTIVWDLALVALRGDTLVFHPISARADSVLRLPVMRVDELRLVQKSEKRQFAPDGQGTGNGLTGGADVVWSLTLLGREERVRVIQQVVRDYPP
jgi:hypothetical protein